MIAKHQCTIYNKLYPLVIKYIHELEHVKVPFIPKPPIKGKKKHQKISSDLSCQENIVHVSQQEEPAVFQLSPEGCSVSSEGASSVDNEKTTSLEHRTEEDDNDLERRLRALRASSTSSQSMESQESGMPNEAERRSLTLENISNNTKTNISEALTKNTQLVKQLTVEQEKAEDIAKSVIAIEDLTPPEILSKEEAFESDTEVRVDGIGSSTSSLSDSQDVIATLDKMEKITDPEKFAILKTEVLQQHLSQIGKDIHRSMERILTMFVVAYEELDTGAGRDICHAVVEVPFFRPLWPYLLALYR